MVSWFTAWFLSKDPNGAELRDAVDEHRTAATHAKELASEGSRDANGLLKMSENALAILNRIECKKKAQ